MRITYDPEVDAMYIYLVEGDHQLHTVQLSDDVNLDFDSQEKLVGIEILDAKRVVGKGKLPRLIADNLPLKASRKAVAARASKTIFKNASRVRKAG